MKYTKPQILSTVRADVAIQSGNVLANKGNPIHVDQLTMPSTTTAYEADE